MRRSFVIINNDGEHVGRYLGNTPIQAASKAFTYIRHNNRGMLFNEFSELKIKETTRGSQHKIYDYKGRFAKYDNPQDIDCGRQGHCEYNRIVRYSGKNVIKKLK